MVLFLASLPGALEQRDGRRETALAVARRRRHSGLEELLLGAGAKPEHASFAAAPSSSQEGTEGSEDEYCSWSAEERWQYRHGGRGGRAPPSSHRGGRFGSRGRGRGSGAGGRGLGGGRARTRGDAEAGGAKGGSPGAEQQPPPSRCPW